MPQFRAGVGRLVGHAEAGGDAFWRGGGGVDDRDYARTVQRFEDVAHAGGAGFGGDAAAPGFAGEDPADFDVSRCAERLDAGDTGNNVRRLFDERAHAHAVFGELARLTLEKLINV